MTILFIILFYLFKFDDVYDDDEDSGDVYDDNSGNKEQCTVMVI